MHKTEGLHNDSGLFTDGPPGTNIEQNWCNAVQEEIVYVIEQAGITLNTAGTETRTQLKDAINTMISGAGGAGSLQSIDCNLNANKEILPTVDGMNNLYIGTTAKTFAMLYEKATNLYLRADTDISIQATGSSYIEGDSTVQIRSISDGAAKGYFGTGAHSFDEIYMNCDNELDIICGDLDINATGLVDILSGGTTTITTDSTFKLATTANGIDDLYFGESGHMMGDIFLWANSEFEINCGTWDVNCTTGSIDVVNTITLDAGANFEITTGADLFLAVTGNIILPQTIGFHANQTVGTETRNLFLGDGTYKWADINMYAADDMLISIDDNINITSGNSIYLTAVATIDLNVGAADTVRIDDNLTIPDRATDPPYPANGECVIWMSDGTKTGTDGDVFCASSDSGGTHRYAHILDVATAGVWTRVA